ncbi:succinylglutamate desuccinylase/aspartoacylase family protein [Marinigracilibium pacificum]|uniref:Succinylglutamate desuccinylase/aspartoacylase family protein n=1 Tax=Marinigracilibium pacificum TaxID=2729599 RepID=A0A848J627_9BACT|nr:succinylglutamate desuccinylase/aspartoacylase family protein [Marinigracilibium pacificum]NMM49970.1 succinylglutamate desuccinylase/aspartoacylase family protein [Marinigracilibium pacificum]
MKFNSIPLIPGEEIKVDINIAKLPSHSPIDITITTYKSPNPGPVLLLTGGLHGDEINGVEIIRRIMERNIHKCKAGAVICIPIINIYGFIHFSRYVPDGKDVNRSFPGNKNGSLASRIAYYLMKEVIPLIDYGIDFHTGGSDRTNYPQVRCKLSDPTNQKLADAFHAPFTLDSAYRPNSLRKSVAREGKHIIVYEGGESSRFDEFAIEEGVNGTIRMMNMLGMTDEYVDPLYENRIIKNSSWIRAGNSGIFLSKVRYGDSVNKNQIVGNIFDPFGDFSLKVKSPVTGYVIGLNHDPIVHQGDALMHIGVVRR